MEFRKFKDCKGFCLDIRFTFARSLANHFPSVSKTVQNPRGEYRETRNIEVILVFQNGKC